MKLIRASVATLVVVLMGAAAASADQTLYTEPGMQAFFGGGVTIAQGEKVTFTNTDTLPHDVTAVASGPDGKKLFQTAGTVQPGTSAPVAGTEYLTTGKYDFVCTIHNGMNGTLTVTADGTPQPRPGGSGGSGGTNGPPPPQGSDTTAPSIQVKVLDTKRSAIRKRRSLQLSITSNEAAAVKLTATSGKTVVASGTGRLSKAGTKKVSIKLTKAGLNLVKKSKTLKIAVAAHAVDASGNATDASAQGRLK